MHFVDSINFALLRPAYQSSTFGNRTASLAVDGITADDLGAHTGDDYHSWWKVQLAFPVWVTHVEIVNRNDAGKQRI